MNIFHVIGAPITVLFTIFAMRESYDPGKMVLFTFCASLGAAIFFL